MKKILSLLSLMLLVAVLLSGCSTKKERILYKETDLSKHIELGKYKELKVDTESKEFKELLETVYSSDATSNGYYVKKTEGKVASGDTANIDYEGKLNGVAFEGGTDKGYDLKIGSNSFIDGFETGLIGKEIGKTVDLNLKFPDNYGSEELAGKAVVFTVKINYVTTNEPQKPEQYYDKLGYKKLEDYEKNVKERALDSFIVDMVINDSKITSFPEEDKNIILASYINQVTQQVKAQTGLELDAYLDYIKQSREDFEKEVIANYVEPTMKRQMVAYSIIDNEKITITEQDVDDIISREVKKFNQENTADIKASDLTDFYGRDYFEYITVFEKAVEIIKESAKIS